MTRTLFGISGLLGGIGLILMGLALVGTSLGVRAVQEQYGDAVMGAIMASYFAGFVIGSFILPPLVRRTGQIRAYAALGAIGSVCAFLHAILPFPLAWALLRCVTGIAMVGIYMVIEGWLNALAPNERRGKLFGFYMMTSLGAQAAGQFLLLLDPEAGVAAFGIAAMFFSLGIVPVALTRQIPPVPVEAPAIAFRELRRRARLSLAAAFVAGLVTSSFWGLGAVYASRVGLPPQQIALFMAALITGGVLLQWPVGHFSDRHGRGHVMIALALLGTAAATFAAFAPRLAPHWLYLSAAMVGGAVFTLYGLSVAYLNDRIHTDAALDAARAILLVFGVGSALGPILAGAAMQAGGPAALPLHGAAVLAMFAVYALHAVRTTRPVAEEDRAPFLPMDQTSQAALDLDPRFNGDNGEGEEVTPAPESAEPSPGEPPPLEDAGPPGTGPSAGDAPQPPPRGD